VRTVIVWHITWSVNSLAHLRGYRTYDTGEQSCNNWFVTLISNGEGWHNNHHADPRSARHGHRWWEIDLVYVTIWALEAMGLAQAVRRPDQRPLSGTSRPKQTGLTHRRRPFNRNGYDVAGSVIMRRGHILTPLQPINVARHSKEIRSISFCGTKRQARARGVTTSLAVFDPRSALKFLAGSAVRPLTLATISGADIVTASISLSRSPVKGTSLVIKPPGV